MGLFTPYNYTLYFLNLKLDSKSRLPISEFSGYHCSKEYKILFCLDQADKGTIVKRTCKSLSGSSQRINSTFKIKYINIYVYLFLMFRDVKEGYEVAGDIKSETQVLKIWDTECSDSPSYLYATVRDNLFILT